MVKTLKNRHLKRPQENISILLLNAQSVKNKDLEIRNVIEEYKADFTIITETWLSDKDSLWIEGCELNRNGLKIDVVNRHDRRGGGLAIVHSCRNVSKTNSGATRSFEFAVWKIQLKNITVNVLAVYRPPYSSNNKVTVGMFLEDIATFLQDFIRVH